MAAVRALSKPAEKHTKMAIVASKIANEAFRKLLVAFTFWAL